jgi:hypothetical protein
MALFSVKNRDLALNGQIVCNGGGDFLLIKGKGEAYNLQIFLALQRGNTQESAKDLELWVIPRA